jgi:hypothetical protein
MNTGPWKCRTVDAEENQKQVSLCAPSAWKSQKARFPHSHRECFILFAIQNQHKEPGGGSLRSRLQAHLA